MLELIDEFVAERSAVAERLQAVSVPSTLDVNAYARAAAVALTVMQPPPRVQHRGGCRCSRKGSQTPLVKAYACDDGLSGVGPRDRIPDAARRPTTPLHESDTAWPAFRFAGAAGPGHAVPGLALPTLGRVPYGAHRVPVWSGSASRGSSPRSSAVSAALVTVVSEAGHVRRKPSAEIGTGRRELPGVSAMPSASGAGQLTATDCGPLAAGPRLKNRTAPGPPRRAPALDAEVPPRGRPEQRADPSRSRTTWNEGTTYCPRSALRPARRPGGASPEGTRPDAPRQAIRPGADPA